MIGIQNTKFMRTIKGRKTVKIKLKLLRPTIIFRRFR